MDKITLYAEHFEYYGDTMILTANEEWKITDPPMINEMRFGKILVPVIELSGPKFRALLNCELQRQSAGAVST